MKINEYLKDQKQIFWDLLAATILELDRYPDILKGELVFGANETVLSFRNCGKGLLPGVITKAILTEEGRKDCLNKIEKLLPQIRKDERAAIKAKKMAQDGFDGFIEFLHKLKG